MRASGAKVVAMRLVADTMLGRLAKWLRVLGYDTLYWRGDDEGLLLVARREGRLVLTRDTRLPSRLPPGQTLFIDSDYYDEQLRQVVARLGRPSQQGHRCLRCNLLLESVDRAEVRGQVPEYVWARHARFARCAGCRRIYWEGTHVQRMAETLQRLCG
jgi:hypothetical protein